MDVTALRQPSVRVFTGDDVYDDEIIVDSFAGGGGASLGIHMALGRGPDIAINHDAEAIALHKANHPNTEHYIENVWRVDPIAAVRGRRVGLMWLSPDCKHFSKAKGGQPVSKKIRGLAWIAVRWAVAVRPRMIVLENVEEFQGWGPVLPNGQPCPKRKGKTFRAFVRKLERLGYVVEWRELKASLYNTPTIRKRLFMIARCDGQPIIWPEEETGKNTGVPERAAAECIDWTIPCPSIFDRKKRGKKALAKNTMRRIARGIEKFVVNNPTPFIVGVGGRMGQSPERPVTGPLQTLTGKADSAVVIPHITKFHTNSVGTPMDEPMHTVTSNGHNTERPGCAIPLGLVEATCTPILVGAGGPARAGEPRSVEVPMGTLMTRNDEYVVAPTIIPTAHQGDARAYSVEQPITTITGGKRGDHALIAPSLVKYHSAKREGDDRVGDLQEPLPTQDTENRFAVVAPFLKPRYGEDPDPSRRGGLGQAPRCRSLEDPMPVIVPTANGGDLVTPFLAKHYSDQGQRPGSQMDEPVSTVTPHDHHSLVAVHMAQHNTGEIGHTVEKPLSTIVQKGCTQALVASHLSKMYGTTTGQSLEDPMHTITANDRGGGHIAEVRAFLVSFYSTKQNTGDVRKPMATVTPKDRFGLVNVFGVEYEIVDIGMRMLQPRELYRAQGFPDSYKIEVPFDYVTERKSKKTGKKVRKVTTKTLTKTAQVRMCGNSVCPPLARAIIAANYKPAQRQQECAA